MMYIYGALAYLGVGFVVTTCIWLYYRNRGAGDGFFFNPFPEWALFIIAVVIFPLNLLLQYQSWSYSRKERKKRIKRAKELQQ